MDQNTKESWFEDNKRLLKFTLTDKDQTPNVVLNISGLDLVFSITAGARTDYGDAPDFVKTSNPAAGIVKTDAVNGLCEVTIDDADVAGFDGDYYWQLEAVDGTGAKTMLADGEVEFSLNINNVAA